MLYQKHCKTIEDSLSWAYQQTQQTEEKIILKIGLQKLSKLKLKEKNKKKIKIKHYKNNFKSHNLFTTDIPEQRMKQKNI